MKDKVIISLPGNEKLSTSLAGKLNLPEGKVIIRQFPDGESYIRLEEDVQGKEIIMVCTLNEPDNKLLPLYFLSQTLIEFGAAHVTLVSPYLAYMRQDKRFNPGEAVTSTYFARLLSGFVDRLVTIDPHLHRRTNLSEIYSIPTQVLHAAPLISAWIKQNIKDAVLIGPDDESAQWVKEVAEDAGVPHLVLHKERRGDNDVVIHVPDMSSYKNNRPVLVDDIISTAHTMAETVTGLKKAGFNHPVCIGVHGVLAGNAAAMLSATGAEIITTNSIGHETNRIDISDLLSSAFTNI